MIRRERVASRINFFVPSFSLTHIHNYPPTHIKVTCEYDYIDGLLTPIRVHSIVVSAQHEEDMDLATMRQHLQEHVIKTVIPEEYMDENTTVYLQPSGRYESLIRQKSTLCQYL